MKNGKWVKITNMHHVKPGQRVRYWDSSDCMFGSDDTPRVAGVVPGTAMYSNPQGKMCSHFMEWEHSEMWVEDEIKLSTSVEITVNIKDSHYLNKVKLQFNFGYMIDNIKAAMAGMGYEPDDYVVSGIALV